MKTIRLHAPGDMRFHDEPLPLPEPGETLVRVTSVGICGSDLHWFNEAGIGDARLSHPLVLGHEFSGVTEKGQRVAVDPAVPCDQCENCRAGHPNLCPNVLFAGHGDLDGALREWISWPTRNLFPLPDSISDAEGAMLEPLGVALHAFDLGKLKPGKTVGVFGCGPIGLLLVQLIEIAGAKCVVTEPLAHRLEVAKRLGATEWTYGQAVDIAFECAGDNAAIDDALNAVKPGGRVVLVGIPNDDQTTFKASLARRKGLTIKLSRRMKHTYPRAIHLVVSRQVDVRSLVTHQYPLEMAVQAFDMAKRREGLKVMIKPNE